MGTPSLFTTIVPITPWNKKVFLFATTRQSYSELWWRSPRWTWWAPPRCRQKLCQSHPKIWKFSCLPQLGNQTHNCGGVVLCANHTLKYGSLLVCHILATLNTEELEFTPIVLTAPWKKSKKRKAEHASYPDPDNQDWIIYTRLLWRAVWRKRNRARWVTVPSRRCCGFGFTESGSDPAFQVNPDPESRVLMTKN